MPWSGVHDRDPRGFRLKKLTEDLNKDQISTRKGCERVEGRQRAGGQPLETPHVRSGYREEPAEDVSRSSPGGQREKSCKGTALRARPEEWLQKASGQPSRMLAGQSGETAKAVRVTEAMRTLTREVPGVWAAGSQTTGSETVTGKQH